MTNPQTVEVEQNYDFFRRNLMRWISEYHGQYALLRDQRLLGMYDDFASAYRAGQTRFSDARFSVQEVTDEPAHLGGVASAVY